MADLQHAKSECKQIEKVSQKHWGYSRIRNIT